MSTVVVCTQVIDRQIVGIANFHLVGDLKLY